MDYQLQNTVCKHIHAVVQLCGVKLDYSNSETDTLENVVNLIELQSVVVFKLEPADSLLENQTDDSSSTDTEMIPLDNQPDDPSTNAADMDISLDVECETIDDSEGHLKEIDDLMNTIRGSLVASVDRNLFNTAKKRYIKFASQIHAAANGSSGASAKP